MNGPQLAAAVAAGGLLLLVMWQRRIMLTMSCMGVFFVTNIFIILIGVLSYPFVENPLWYSGMKSELITERAIILAIVLNAGAIALIVAAYHTSHALTTGRFLQKAPNLLAPNVRLRLGFSLPRLLLLTGFVLLTLGTFVIRHFSTIAFGLYYGLLQGQNDLVIQTRMAIGQDYLAVLVIYNVLPFVGVALWLAARTLRRPLLMLMALGYSLIAIGMLLITFQKRPVLLYLLSLLAAEVWVRSSRMANEDSLWRRWKNRRQRMKPRSAAGSAITGLAMIFGCLMMLYYAHASFARGEGFSLGPIIYLFKVAASSTIYGLALPAIMQAAYFPAVGGFYGISNLRIVSRLTGEPLYGNTIELYRYFYDQTIGSVAVPAVMDGYGAFGIPGWLLTCFAIGILLERFDTILGRRPRSAATTLLAIYLFVFCFYLSHASIPNSAMGYGGGIFILLWLLLTMRLKPVGNHATTGFSQVRTGPAAPHRT